LHHQPNLTRSRIAEWFQRASFANTTRSRANAVLLVICLCQVMVAVDITIIQVANVIIKNALGFPESDLQWLVTSYSLTFGGWLLFGGRVGDIVGHRNMFVIGLIAFGVASLGASLSQSPWQLVAFRALQGTAAAFASPAALALLADTFPEGAARQHAFGYWQTAGSLGGIIGYVLGGLIVAHLGWRWIFLINLPIVAISAVGALLVIPSAKASGLRVRHLDAPGAITVTCGIALLIFALGEAESAGWRDAITLWIILASAATIGMFILIEQRTTEPLLPFRILRRPESRAIRVVCLSAATVTGTIFLGSLYMQQRLGFSPERTGAAMLPIPLGVATGAALTSVLFRRRVQSRVLVVCGQLLMALGVGYLALELERKSYWSVVLPAWFVLGFGLAGAQIALISVATSNVGPQDRGLVGGIYNMAQQIGIAVGLATLATVATSVGGRQGQGNGTTALPGLGLAFFIAAAIALVAAIYSAWRIPTVAGALAPTRRVKPSQDRSNEEAPKVPMVPTACRDNSPPSVAGAPEGGL
jgi:EmrB/QacA subfamily drug resistance transporter